MPTNRRKRRQRQIFIPLAILLVAGLGALALFPILSGRTSPPRTARESALRAVAQAQARQAERWAPEALATATTALARAQAEYRAQAARFLPRRDFRAARSFLQEAETLAWETATAAVQARRTAKRDAEESLRRATEYVAIARAFGSLMPLSGAERTRLARAQLRASEASPRLQAGEFALGAALAAEAESLAGEVGAACAKRAGRYADTKLLERWRRMIEETVTWSRRSGRPAIIVSKATNTLTLYRAGRPKRSYRADLGTNNVAEKSVAGDHATPEGKYKIVAKKGLGQSTYYKALLLDYPSAEDLERFRRLRQSGQAKARDPGGQIEIHGEGGRQKDWTRGCVALTNQEMDELFDAVAVGTPVVIVGSHGDGGPFIELVMRYHAAAGGRP